jgi:hypothetical protein
MDVAQKFMLSQIRLAMLILNKAARLSRLRK